MALNLRPHLATEMAVAIVALSLLTLNAGHDKRVFIPMDLVDLVGGGLGIEWEVVTVVGWPFDDRSGYAVSWNVLVGILLLLGTGFGFHQWYRKQSVSGTALAAGEALQTDKFQFGLKEVLFATLCFAIFFFLCRPLVVPSHPTRDVQSYAGTIFSGNPWDEARALSLLPVSFAIGSCCYAILGAVRRLIPRRIHLT